MTCGAELPVDLTYTYTPRSQIASINDQTVANIDQAFTYDGIGRLTASTGPWGAGTFQYDGLGNLRQRSVGTRTVGMSYDASAVRCRAAQEDGGGEVFH